MVRIINGMGRRLQFHQFVAIRHLRGRKSGFLTAIGLLAILGVSFSSCTLTTVLSVMGGFSDDLKQKILSTNAHIVIDNFGANLNGLPMKGERKGDKQTAVLEKMDNWRELLAHVQKMENVQAATPVVQGEVMMNARTNNNGMLLKGVDTSSLGKVSGILSKLDEGKVAYINHPEKLFEFTRRKNNPTYSSKKTKYKSKIPPKPDPAKTSTTAKDPDKQTAPDSSAEKEELEDVNEFIPKAVKSPRQRVLPAVIVGREMAKSLRLYVGEEVNIISPLGDIGPTGPIPKSRPFRIGGTFFSGMYAFDEHYAYTSIDDAQTFLSKGDSISEIHISVANSDNAGIIAAQISESLGNRLRVRSWQELNAELFSALKLEKIVMFIFLSFAILVASFCIIATLTMLVLEKSAEIAVLMTIGATSKDVMHIFRFEGLLIGLVGTLSGLSVGLLLSLTLKYFGLPIDPEVWYIDKLPVNISPIEFVFVGLASLGITQLATLYPTRVASGISPVEGLKND